MKQHLNQTDILSLSEEQRTKIQEWWTPSEGDICAHIEDEKALVFTVDFHTGLTSSDYKTLYVPLLSIGQLLEFIDYHLQFPEISEVPGDCDHLPNRYKLEFYIDPKPMSPHGGHAGKKWSTESEELCDALFEAIKELL